MPAMIGHIVPDAVPPDGAGVLYRLLFESAASSPALSASLAALLVFGQALLVNWLVNESRVNPERNWLASFFFVLVSSCTSDFLWLSPALVAAAVIPVALRIMFSVYKTNETSLPVFDVGLWIGVGGLFYVPLLWLAPVCLLGLVYLRSLKLREILVMLTGLLAPWLIAYSVALLNDQGGAFRSAHFQEWSQFWDFHFPDQWDTLSQIVVLSLLFIVVLLSFNVYYYKRLMQIQKYNNIFYWIILGVATTILFRNQPQTEHFIIAGTPMGIFLALSFQSIKNKAVAEILVLALIALIFAPLLLVLG